MEILVPLEKMVPERTRFPARASEILRVPDCEVRLARERIFAQMLDKTIVITERIPYAMRMSSLVF
jgi:hypothetical protein